MSKSAKVIGAIALFVTAIGTSQSFADANGVPNSKAKGYWTQERMNSAKPIELIVDEASGVGKIQVAASAKSSGKTTSSSGSSTIQSTTDWPTDAPIAQTAVGKVFFTASGSNYVCSGALVKDGISSLAIVATAGHCVWEQNSAGGGFVSNWIFVPNFDGNPNGTQWAASALVVRDEFASQTSFNITALQNDWAFAVIKSDSGNLPDNNDANAYALSVSGFSANNASFAFGYPAQAPFNGQSLKYAGATIFVDPNTKSTWGMNSTMTGGASGGPWLSNGTSRDGLVFGQSGAISSVNSYKYNRDSTKMYGPFFNTRTTATFNAAKTAASNTRVSG